MKMKEKYLNQEDDMMDRVLTKIKELGFFDKSVIAANAPSMDKDMVEKLEEFEKLKYGNEAYELIKKLRNNIEEQANKNKQLQEETTKLLTEMKNENEKMLEDGYQEAYGMLVEEKEKYNKLDSLYSEEYDKRLQDMKNWVVKKLDEFLAKREQQLAECDEEEMLEKISEWRKSFTPQELVKQAMEEDEEEKLSSKLTTENVKQSMKIKDLTEKLNEANQKLTKSEALNGKLPEDLIKENEELKAKCERIQKMAKEFYSATDLLKGMANDIVDYKLPEKDESFMAKNSKLSGYGLGTQTYKYTSPPRKKMSGPVGLSNSEKEDTKKIQKEAKRIRQQMESQEQG